MIAAILAALPLAGCATSDRGDPRLEITASVEQGRVAVIELRNLGSGSVALSRTHCACGSWLTLEIEDEAGRRVAYPPETPEHIIVTPPRYECVRPGESISWRIDLGDFRLVFGGEVEAKRLSFRLAPGDYRLRARYTDDRRRRGGCSAPSVDLVSPWTRFTVR